jgi:large subunit ribosomal protein L18
MEGTEKRPRLAVFRSNRYMYAQLIDDTRGATIAAVDTRSMKAATALLRAKEAGAALAALAQKHGLTEVVFDRGGFQYKGAIVAFAEGAREGGLKF